ncbi:MAG TPA: hypothetical protein VFA68_13615 [Terriglobales bacterium]|nr:hypothetical protein [Terriglobales bacterium]
MPSLSDLAFPTPILVLFWCTTGVGWLLTDSDTGWHIRAGEWILKNGRVPATDLFSFTKAGQPWFAWEWLSDVLMAVVHRHFGLAGIVLVSLLLLGATSVCVYRSTLEESGHRVIAIVLTGLAMSASTIHWLARPHLVTPLFAAVFCWALNRTKRKRGPAVLWALPALTILWVNLHGGFFVGIVLLITYAIGAVAEELIHGARHNVWVRARKYAWTAVACALASLINPYGYQLHVHVAGYLGASFYFQRISEFQSIDFHSFTAAYFETLLVLAIAAAVWHLGAGRLVHVLLLLSWSHLGLFSARNIPIFAVVAAPGIGLAVREWLEYTDSRWPLQWPGRFSASLAELDAGLRSIANIHQRRHWHFVPWVGVLVLALLLTHPGRVKALYPEFDRNRFPVDAAVFLSQRESVPAIRLYSSWQWGGYLIYRLWPSFSVFDDGRTDFYGPAFVEEGLCAWDACPDWANILARYRVNAALLPVGSGLATVLHERRDWKPVYQDRVAVLFERTESAR